MTIRGDDMAMKLLALLLHTALAKCDVQAVGDALRSTGPARALSLRLLLRAMESHRLRHTWRLVDLRGKP